MERKAIEPLKTDVRQLTIRNIWDHRMSDFQAGTEKKMDFLFYKLVYFEHFAVFYSNRPF